MCDTDCDCRGECDCRSDTVAYADAGVIPHTVNVIDAVLDTINPYRFPDSIIKPAALD